MCTAGRLIADFTAGTCQRPAVPDEVHPSLTTTADGQWVVWAHKIAHPSGDRFTPLTGGPSYPTDAVAECRRGGGHEVPSPACTCGFHAVSDAPPFAMGALALDVVLSGRVLAFEWKHGVLFRAERQTVVRVALAVWPRGRRPDDPDGRLARVRAGLPHRLGPERLTLPIETPLVVAVDDDAGYCIGAQTAGVRHDVGVLMHT